MLVENKLCRVTATAALASKNDLRVTCVAATNRCRENRRVQSFIEGLPHLQGVAWLFGHGFISCEDERVRCQRP